MSQAKTFREFIDIHGADHLSGGDISLASFLVAHGFSDRKMSVGSIGLIPRFEALALNAMLSPQASLVVLIGDTLSQQRNYISEIVSEIEASSVPLRLQFADLTLSTRWPQILSAMAHSEIGVLGIDARWAAMDPSFWRTLQDFMQTRRVLVYVRNMLDYRHPELAMPFIRSMPEDCTLDVVATTPGSVWFAADAVQGTATRDLLRGCGLFPQSDIEGSAGSPKAPIVVTDERALRQTDSHGRLPRVAIGTNNDSSGGVDYITGWSDAEGDGCWTAGPDAALRMMLPPGYGVPRALAITGNSWIPANMKDQVIKIGIGNKPTGWTEMNFADPEEILTATVDVTGVQIDPSGLIVRVKVQTPGRPSDFGGSDTRLLGFKMRAISIFT